MVRTGRNQKPVVQRELTIGAVHQRVLERRDDDRRLQVVRVTFSGTPPNHSKACMWQAKKVSCF